MKIHGLHEFICVLGDLHEFMDIYVHEYLICIAVDTNASAGY